jgi:hypothetical protein
MAVRVEVARHQLIMREGTVRALSPLAKYPGSAKERLGFLLECLFGDAKVHLDHDPPLGARAKIMRGGEIIGYRPAANDSECLVYRLVIDHQIKTNVHGEHGQHPDRVLIKKQRRRERPHPKRRRVKIAQREEYRWPSRPFRSKQ